MQSNGELNMLLKISQFNPVPALRQWLNDKKRSKERLCDELKPRKKKRKYVETIDTYVYSVSLGVSGLFLSS